MSYPLPRGEPGNLLTGPADYDLNSPLPSALMCKAKPPGRPTATFRAGETINVKFKGSARHGGGMCQFALSYDDDRTFIAIATVNGARPSADYTWPVPLPANLPSCERCTFAWTWINAIGNREYYMNCADISIIGDHQGNSIRGTPLFIANLPGYQVVQPPQKDGGPRESTLSQHPIISV